MKIGAAISDEEYTKNLKNLADKLRACPGNIRKKICDIYGFKIHVDGDEYLVSHDGQRIGSGQVEIEGIRTKFDVYPKNMGIKLNELFKIYDDGLYKKYGKVHQFGNTAGEGKPDEFSFSFLIGLLNEIANFGIQFFNIYSTRKIIYSRSKPVGKIIPRAFVLNQLKGNYDNFECEILDNSTLRLFATVFYHSAIAISQELQKYSINKAMSGVNIDHLERRTISRLKPYLVEGFSRQMLNRISKPPYPFGVSELFFKCYKYWQYRGKISASNTKFEMPYSGFSVKLNDLFEDYVGLVFYKVYKNKYGYVPKSNYKYFIDESQERRLEPDHLFVNEELKELVIVEVKYSNAIATREHVSQIISYLDYKYSDWKDFKVKGILAYPGSTFSCKKIHSFKHDLSIITLSSSIEDSYEGIAKECSTF